MVNFFRLDFIEDIQQVACISHIPVMKVEAGSVMWILVQVIDSVSVKRTRPANQSMNFISFPQQKLGQIGTVLTSNSGD